MGTDLGVHSESYHILWIPTLQSLDGFKKYLHPCALNISGLSIRRVEC